MFGILALVAINGIAFFIISKILPGFKIKNGQIALAISVVYSVFAFVGSLLIKPFFAIIGFALKIFSIIPIIGPMIAGAGILVATFIVNFGISVILLIVIDKMMDDFEMSSIFTAFGASFLLAILNVGMRILIPGI